jgi:hypothetical protein
VEGYRGSSLLELLTQSEETLWLWVHEDTSLEGLDLVKLSMDVMQRPRQTPTSSAPRRGPPSPLERAYPTFAGAQIPMIDFDLQSDLGWLLKAGLSTTSGDDYFMEQAKQQFKLRMDETGARVKVATTLQMHLASFSYGPRIFTVDRPFYGWWTLRGVEVPMAAFFADWDCWRRPEGALEAL